jgi:SRSO17 transposase
VSCLYQNKAVSLPVNFRLVEKTEKYIDPKTKKEKRRSKVTKNELARKMIKQVIKNQVEFSFILFDVWFASKENLNFIKQEQKCDFVCPLKSNRKVALSPEDKRAGRWHKVSTLEIEENAELEIYLEGVEFPLTLIKQVFRIRRWLGRHSLSDYK